MDLGLREFVEAASWIAGFRRPLLLSHVKPDGDALGSLVAMRTLLAARGVAATAVIFDELSTRYTIFARHGKLPCFPREIGEEELAACDAVIVLDTCSYNQLEPVADWLRRCPLPKMAIDHHHTRDELADRYLIDSSAAANCLLLYELARASGWKIEQAAAEALFIGLAMDTGWFRHANTNERALQAAGELAGLGANPNALFIELYQRETAGRIRLLGRAVESLELHEDDRLALMTLPASAFPATGATRAETEDIVNEPLRIATVRVSALLVEHDEGFVRVNLRAKAAGEGADAQPAVDIAAVAQLLGGGGHRAAAGGTVRGDVATVRGTVIDVLRRALFAGST